MNLFVILPSIIFTMFASASIAYISMATMVGPWIAPTLVLMSSIVLKMRPIPKSRHETNKEMALIQTVGSVGGIVATGIGFSLPTLYFLDPHVFNSWLKSPLYFCFVIAAICFSAGGLGIWLARCFAQKFIEKDKLDFPVSKIIYKMITSQTQQKQAKGMFFGFATTWLICFLRDGVLWFKGLLPRIFYIFPNVFGKELLFAICPMYLAIGFITGVGIAIPLLIGMICKYLVLYPINHHSLYLPFKLFPVLSDTAFITAFCSGLVVSELILGLLKYPGIIYKKIKNFSRYDFWNKIESFKENFKTNPEARSQRRRLFLHIEPISVLVASFALFKYLNFSFLSQILLLLFIVMATYQISFLGGKIGLITFGRFATFIMIPMMLLFKLNFIQITFLCVFFNVCAASASDLLFDYKVGQLCNIDFNKIHQYQWLGLLITSLCIGLFLWLFFTNFEIGSAQLFAQRGRSRALLIQSIKFNWLIVFIGFLFGLILKKLKISPTMVFGGILMPNDLTIGLVIGAVGSWFSKKPTAQQPFWSGIFAGESIWILFSILLKVFC